MTSYFNYRTNSKLSTSDKQKILQETAQLQRSHAWWVEPIFFRVADLSGKPTADALFDLFRNSPSTEQHSLSGRTKIFLVSYSAPGGVLVNVDPDEDTLMTYKDLKFITELLCEWSRLYNLDWDLSCGDEHIGAIGGGVCDLGTSRFLQDFISSTPLIDSHDIVEAISKKHGSRNDW